jgi:hypothetical protein
MSTVILETKTLTRRFGAFTAVDALTLSVNASEIFGLLGSNGAGKTTAIKMLTTVAALFGRGARGRFFHNYPGGRCSPRYWLCAAGGFRGRFAHRLREPAHLCQTLRPATPRASAAGAFPL